MERIKLILKRLLSQALRGGGTANNHSLKDFVDCHSELVSESKVKDAEQPRLMYIGQNGRFSMTSKRVAFTLAETIIVLAVLGIIAMLIIPSVVQRQIEASNRAKIKKNMSVYDLAIQKMTIENDLKNMPELKKYAEDNDCANSYKYFKTIEQDGCQFTSPDKVYWDISEIDHPIIALDRESRDNPDESKLGKTMFKFVTSFDGHAFRSNDAAYEKALLLADLENLNEEEQKEKIEELEALFGFVSGKKVEDGSNSMYCNNSEKDSPYCINKRPSYCDNVTYSDPNCIVSAPYCKNGSYDSNTGKCTDGGYPGCISATHYMAKTGCQFTGVSDVPKCPDGMLYNEMFGLCTSQDGKTACPTKRGFKKIDSSCQYNANGVLTITPQCPSGYTFSGLSLTCNSEVSSLPPVVPQCPSGFSYRYGECVVSNEY